VYIKFDRKIDRIYYLCHFLFLFFFFSSRRRHTRSKRDWSSDVCSSDLTFPANRGTCFRSKANPNERKTFHSCTLGVQSGPNRNPKSDPSLRQTCASHLN